MSRIYELRIHLQRPDLSVSEPLSRANIPFRFETSRLLVLSNITDEEGRFVLRILDRRGVEWEVEAPLVDERADQNE